MKTVILDNNKYILVKEYKNGFDPKALEEKYTDYFNDYDYILGDWAYGKLRLKGFCDKENSKFNNINNYDNIDLYIKEDCAYECSYFIIKKAN